MSINWPGPAGSLRGVTVSSLDRATAGFTVADWARIEDEHLDVIVINGHLLPQMALLGVDTDDDPIAVFCRLYLKARAARIRVKPQIDPEDAERQIRRALPIGARDTLNLHECTTAWIYALIQDGADRPAGELLADVSALLAALHGVEDEVYSERGWYDDEPVGDAAVAA